MARESLAARVVTRQGWVASALLAVGIVGPAAAQQLAVTEVRIDSIGALTEVALRLVEWLADSVATMPGRQTLLDRRDVWVVPVLNPDGYAHTFSTERLWRKNRRRNVDGTVGVDLNRNYPAFWGRDEVGSSDVPGAETFRGTGPASEPVAAASVVSVSENPVRSDRVFLSWAPVGGQATVSLLTFIGELVFRATVPAQDGQLLWDLTNRNGVPVSDGAYVVVVELPTEVLRRRLFVARGR